MKTLPSRIPKLKHRFILNRFADNALDGAKKRRRPTMRNNSKEKSEKEQGVERRSSKRAWAAIQENS